MFTILLVEDDETLRKMIKEMLVREFPLLHVAEAATGEEALEQIRLERPGLIFMDIKLPGKNGLRVTREIKGMYPCVSVVIFTSYDLPEYRAEAFRCGAEQFLAKGTTKRSAILSLVAMKLAGAPPDILQPEAGHKARCCDGEASGAHPIGLEKIRGLRGDKPNLVGEFERKEQG